jgi:hypothetical protein
MAGNGARADDMMRHDSGEKAGRYINEITEYVWLGYSSRATSHPPGAPAGIDNAALLVGSEWAIVQRPGFAPLRKGPFSTPRLLAETLRAMYAEYPDCMCLVINMPHTSYPESGQKWLDVNDSDVN